MSSDRIVKFIRHVPAEVCAVRQPGLVHAIARITGHHRMRRRCSSMSCVQTKRSDNLGFVINADGTQRDAILAAM
jgi:hypothetical protein